MSVIKTFRIRLYAGLLAALWTVLIACSLAWNYSQSEKEVRAVSKAKAITAFEWGRLYRKWVSRQEGQGYKVGDVRGGIGAIIPISDVLKASHQMEAANALSHGLIWLLGLGMLGVGSRKLGAGVIALQESEERYRAVVDEQTEIICRLQADGTIVFVNEFYCRFFGKSSLDLLGTQWQPQAFSDDIPMVEKKLAGLSPTNPVTIIENRVYSGTGNVHWVQFVNRGIFDKTGQLMEIQTVGRDITERIHAEESALQSERFMRATIDALSAHICVIDGLGTVISANKGWCDFAAANPPEIENNGIGANYLAICDAAMGDDKEHAREFANGIRSVLNGDSDFYSQEYPCHSESEQRWFLGRVTRFAAGADLVRTVIAHENITERKLAEQNLDKALDEMENLVLERTKSLTVSNKQLHQEIEERKRIEQEILDHQQKLQAMARELIMAEERERDRIAGELHDQVGQRLILGKMKFDALVSRINPEQCENDAEVVRTVLDQSIQDIRSLTFQLRPPVLASAGLEAAIQWLGEEFKEDFGLRIDFSDDCQPKSMRYEVRSTIFQVVRELLLNVTKHAETDHVMIRMKRENDTIVITISDDGVGFDTMEVSKRKVREGGYGLFNIHQRIDYLGGSLVIESVSGTGTRATITVPLEDNNTQGVNNEHENSVG